MVSVVWFIEVLVCLILSVHSECVCVYVYMYTYTYVYTYLCICFCDREGRYDQVQGFFLLWSVFWVFVSLVSYHIFCATAITRLQYTFLL